MAGELTKTTALTNAEDGVKLEARLYSGKTVTAKDSHVFTAATQLEAEDNLLTLITMPSNAIFDEIAIYNDDMDTGCCPTLILDFGLAAAQDYISITSASKTHHKKDDIIDADLLVDGSTEGQTANTNWTTLVPDSGTFGPDDALKPLWELLGYDEDPGTYFRVVMQSQAASSALGADADVAIRVRYSVD